jgi:hypothetical protein
MSGASCGHSRSHRRLPRTNREEAPVRQCVIRMGLPDGQPDRQLDVPFCNRRPEVCVSLHGGANARIDAQPNSIWGGERCTSRLSGIRT